LHRFEFSKRLEQIFDSVLLNAKTRVSDFGLKPYFAVLLNLCPIIDKYFTFGDVKLDSVLNYVE